MADKFVSERNIKFLLYEVFDVESLTQYPYYEEYDKKMFDMILQAAIELAQGILRPVFQEMDSNPPVIENDHIKAHPFVKAMMKEYGEGGWIGATVQEDYGGQQMPHLIADSCLFTFAAANYSGSAFALLSTGAAHLIELFGTQYMLDNYHNYPPEKIARYARERFSCETVGKMLDEVYKNLIGKEGN